MQGKDIANALGISEASVSRYLKRVRDNLRAAIGMAVAGYSWTDDESAQLGTSGLTNADDDAFDQALSDVYLIDEKSRRDYGKMQKTARSVR